MIFTYNTLIIITFLSVVNIFLLIAKPEIGVAMAQGDPGELQDFSWTSSTKYAGTTGITYSFSYTIVTASPAYIFYAYNTGWSFPFLENSSNNYYITDPEVENVTVKVNGLKRPFGMVDGGHGAPIVMT